MTITVPPLVWTLAAGAAAAFLFAIPFAAGISAMAPLYLTAAPLIAAGLGLGLLAAAGAGLSGLAIVAALVALLAFGPEPIVLFAVLFAVPALIAVHLLGRTSTDALGYVRWYAPSSVAAWLAAVAVAAMAFLGTMIMAGGSDVATVTAAFLQPVLTATMPELGLFRTQAIAGWLAPWFPGLVGTVWLVSLCISTAVAFAVLHRRGALDRPLPRMAEQRVPGWLPLLFALALLFAWLDHPDLAYIGRNAALVLLVPMFLVGAGTFHAIANRTPIRPVILAVFYGFIVVFPPLATVVAAIGVADQYLDLRRRAGLTDAGQEA